MSCLCCPTKAAKQRQRSQEIEQWLLQDKRTARRELKFLLMGPKEAGKSTIMKQMQILHGSGYSDEMKSHYIHFVWQNLLMATTTLIQALEVLNISYQNPANDENAKLIKEMKCGRGSTVEKQHIAAIQTLWADAGVQECYDRRKEYQITDSTKYFLDSIERIAKPGYLPTIQDILRVRVPTFGVIDYSFAWDSIHFRMIDVGGQHSEQRKWIHHFESVNSVLFIVPLSDYDHKERIEQAKELFSRTVSSYWLQDCYIFLFLNKKDIFEERIMHSHMVDYYPEFDGPKQDAARAREFMLRMFLDLNQDHGRVIYHHFTCATDTENIRLVFRAVRDAATTPRCDCYKHIFY